MAQLGRNFNLRFLFFISFQPFNPASKFMQITTDAMQYRYATSHHPYSYPDKVVCHAISFASLKLIIALSKFSISGLRPAYLT